MKKNKRKGKNNKMTITSLVLGLALGAGAWTYNTPTLKSGDTKVDSAIVSVMTPEGRGTGFFIEHNGLRLLVTAAHVCGTSKLLLSSKGLHRILVSRPDKDICIASTYQKVDTLKIGAEVTSGDAVDMTGFPGNLIYDYQKGTARDVGVSTFLLPITFYGECPQLSLPTADGMQCQVFITTIQLNILARPGNSGGPVQNAAGEVVGILIGTDGKNGYMAPASELLGILMGAP